MDFLRRKPLSQLMTEADGTGQGLSKALGALDLVMLGIGAIIGTGIFVLTGVAAAKHAGPGLILSFVLSGLACGFAALAYAEFSSSVPVAGSAYTYSYASLGELVAWIIGWDLVLEYALAASAVAVGWSGYFVKLFEGFGVHFPAWAIAAPGAAPGGIINLPALLIILTITVLLSIGIRETAKINNLMVLIKIAVVLLFIAVGIWHVKPANWVPFLPFGFDGVINGAAIVFFAYIGFDAVSTAAEEVKNPQRDLPIGIIGSLVVCTILYIIVTSILTGIVPYTQLDTPAPVALALQLINQNWVAGFVSAGAITGITTVLLVMLYGQTRVFYAMSRDGLLPGIFSKVHPKFKTPFKTTWIVGVVSALMAAFVPLNELAEMVNIGTLSAFVLVSAAVIVMRRSNPDLPRAFRCPGVPYIPILAILFCLTLMLQLPAITWIRFVTWLIIGFAIYFLYGYRHSKMNEHQH